MLPQPPLMELPDPPPANPAEENVEETPPNNPLDSAEEAHMSKISANTGFLNAVVTTATT